MDFASEIDAAVAAVGELESLSDQAAFSWNLNNPSESDAVWAVYAGLPVLLVAAVLLHMYLPKHDMSPARSSWVTGGIFCLMAAALGLTAGAWLAYSSETETGMHLVRNAQADARNAMRMTKQEANHTMCGQKRTNDEGQEEVYGLQAAWFFEVFAQAAAAVDDILDSDRTEMEAAYGKMDTGHAAVMWYSICLLVVMLCIFFGSCVAGMIKERLPRMLVTAICFLCIVAGTVSVWLAAWEGESCAKLEDLKSSTPGVTYMASMAEADDTKAHWSPKYLEVRSIMESFSQTSNCYTENGDGAIVRSHIALLREAGPADMGYAAKPYAQAVDGACGAQTLLAVAATAWLLASGLALYRTRRPKADEGTVFGNMYSLMG